MSWSMPSSSASRRWASVGGAALVVALAAGCPPKPVAPATPPTPPTPPAPPAPLDPLAAARAGCATGEQTACDDLAEHWSQRELGPAAPADAELLRAACDDRKLSSACLGYAIMRKYGTATGTRDADGAAPYFAKLADLGDLNGFRGVPSSPAGQAALAATTKDCDGGRRRACAQLGWAAFAAVQQDKDVVVAFRHWSQACDQGVASACRWAGHVAYHYDEVRDHVTARRLLARSAAADSPGGEDELGNFLETIAHDLGAARGHYLRACELGSRTGCLHAGLALLRDACTAGEPAACLPPPAAEPAAH